MTDELTDGLSALCRDRTGDATAAVGDVTTMPGHAGFSYGFTLRAVTGTERLVLRLPPPGVKHEGTADVVRQARLVEALAETDVPVPAVRWYGEDERWFGRPYSVVGFVEGSVHSPAPGRGSPFDTESPEALAAQAVSALAALHALDWQQVAPHLGPPVEAVTMVTRWDRFAERSAEPALVALAPDVRARLLDRVPDARVGITHGDYQWGNLLFAGRRLAAVLDWELCAAGPVLADLGWLLLFSDPGAWGGARRGFPVVPAPDELAASYAAATSDQVPVADVAWFRALAGYAFAIIGGFNLMLHRRGKRVDPYWEALAPGVPRLFERSLELLGGQR